jgi:hypothetical protein
MPGLWFQFESGRLHQNEQAQLAPAVGVPCIYILAESGLRNPLYIGEYGKAKGYNVLSRIGSHFKNGNLGCLSKNMKMFKLTVPQKVTAWVFELERDFRAQSDRRSLEAWVIFIVCNQLRIHDNRFAVTSFSAPKKDYESLARKIVSSYLSAEN